MLVPETLIDLERIAVDLARLAGAEIQGALGSTLAVRYKGADPEATLFKDPVSEVDQRVEEMLRARLADSYPEHDIVGEEIDERPGRDHATVWVIDPIDGTANFVNGFPLFSASIGVLHEGVPVVGALWCSTSHKLRPGVYHAREGGPLMFDDEPTAVVRDPGVRRRLGGDPEFLKDAALPWDTRKTGSAAIECAFVAAGLLQVARFATPNVWDVGGGLVLVRAAGLEARHRPGDAWEPLDRLPVPEPDKPAWRGPVVIGEADAVERLCRHLG
ncbi:MAG: inositol monophosphatase [Geminicoccaceae bacterium]|nr:inositol monophosphatase [Geminicoccaceae bacterium]